MPWMMFLLAVLSFVVLCYAHSMAVAVACILLIIGFVLAGLLRLMAARVGDSSRDSGHIITTEELRMYREQAQARKQAQADASAAPAAPVEPQPPAAG